MRRNLTGLLVALVILGVCSLVVRDPPASPKVPHSGIRSYTSSDYEHMSWDWETHPSPLGATAKFNALLQGATEYIEFTPCFDARGHRIGERAAMRTTSPHTRRPVWRIVWTQRSEDFSESFTVESPLLSEARHGETTGQDGWKKCISTKLEVYPQ